MQRKRFVVWLFVAAVSVLAAAGSPLRGADDDEGQSLEELVQVLQNVANMPRDANTPEQDRKSFEMLQQGVPQLQSYIQRGDFANARRVVRTWARQTHSENLRKLCQAITVELEKRLDETETPLLDRAEDLIERATTLCREAKSATDLDEVGDALFEFRNFEMGNFHASRTLQRVRMRIDGAVRFVESYQQFLDARANGDKVQALQMLAQIGQRNYGYNTRLLSVSEVAELKRELEQQINDESEAMIDQIVEKFRSDADLEQIQELQTQIDELYMQLSYASSLMTLRNRVEGTRQTLQGWAWVLTAEANGDVPTALDALRQMRTNVARDVRIIPSETIIAKHQSLVKQLNEQPLEYAAEIDALLEPITGSADLDAVDRKLEALRLAALTQSAREDIAALEGDLSQLAALYRALESKRYEQIWLYASSMSAAPQHRWSARTARLRHDVIRRAIAAASGIATFDPASGDETPAVGTLRLADEAAAAGDWQRVYRLLDVYAMAFARDVQPAWLTAELTGCEAFLAGLQLEQFGQKEEAAQCYMTVLHQVGKRIPSKEAAERLAAIRG